MLACKINAAIKVLQRVVDYFFSSYSTHWADTVFINAVQFCLMPSSLAVDNHCEFFFVRQPVCHGECRTLHGPITIRPPDIVVGALMSYHRFVLFLFFVSHSPRSLNRTQPKPVTYSEVSAKWKCMFEIWGIPSHANRGPKTTFFDDFTT